MLLWAALAAVGCASDKGSVDTGTGTTGWCDQDDPPGCEDEDIPCSTLADAPLIVNGYLEDVEAYGRADWFPESVAGGLDFDGDGVGDVAACSASTNPSEGPPYAYAAVVSGARQGEVERDQADLLVMGESSKFRHVAFLPDQDGDGLAELLVGDVKYDDGLSDDPAGALYVFEGGLAGEVELADATGFVAGETSSGGSQAFGDAIDGCQDVTGDGRPDVLVGAADFVSAGEHRGAVYVLAGPITADHAAEEAHAAWYGPAKGGPFGESVSCQGDLDGDGMYDLVVGDPSASDAGATAGAAYVFFGPASGRGAPEDADAILAGASEAARAGSVVVAMGDADGDGYDDLAVAAPGDDDFTVIGDAPQQWTYVVPGPPTSANLGDAPGRVHEGVYSLAGVGDVDGDGRDELLIGYSELLQEYHPHCLSGSAYLYMGPLSGTYDRSNADHAYLSGIKDDMVGYAVADAGMREDGRHIVVGALGMESTEEFRGNAYVLPAVPSSRSRLP